MKTFEEAELTVHYFENVVITSKSNPSPV